MFKQRTHPPARTLARTVLAMGLILGLLGLGQAVWAGNIDPMNKFAWGTNVGWINFDPTCAGCESATVFVNHLEGYAYGENIGWIRLGTHTGGAPHTYANDGSTTYGVNVDSGTGTLSGYAWSTNTGWINFSPTGGGVTIDPATGEFSGYAWGENIGWIRFSGTAQDDTPYKVATADGPLAVTLSYFHAQADGETVEFTWQTATETGTAGFNLLAVTEAGLVQLNHELIPSPVIDSVTPTDYAFEAAIEAISGATRFILQEVGIDGRVIEHGPFDLGSEHGSADGPNDVEMTSRVWLPMVAGE